MNAFLTVEEQGFYRSNVQNLDHVVAVNIDPGESDLESFDPNFRFAAIQGHGKAFTSPREASGVFREDPLQIESQSGIWHFLLGIALAVFMIESLLSNFYTPREIQTKIG